MNVHKKILKNTCFQDERINKIVYILNLRKKSCQTQNSRFEILKIRNKNSFHNNEDIYLSLSLCRYLKRYLVVTQKGNLNEKYTNFNYICRFDI